MDEEEVQRRLAESNRPRNEHHARQKEARRRIELASGATRSKLRVLTVTCPMDHSLIDVYRINSTLVWSGKSKQTRVEWSPTSASHVSKSNRVLTADFVDPDRPPSAFGNGDPFGGCPCGNFSVSAQWILDTVARVDLPSSRRVVAPSFHK